MMERIDEAIAAIELSGDGKQLSYTKAAEKFEVNRSTLARRHQGRQAPRNTILANSRLLNPQQEAELVAYIVDLSRDGTPPTRCMIRNFASKLAQKHVKRSTARDPKDLDKASPHSHGDWLHMERLLRATIKDLSAANSKQLFQTLHELQIRNELLNYENSALREALNDEKHHKKRGKQLGLRTDEEYNSGAVFWSPRKIKEARAHDRQKERDEEAILIQKAEEKERKRVAKAYKHQGIEHCKVEREAKAEARRVKAAEKQAKREREKQERNSKKTLQTSLSGKRKASRAPAPKAKRQKPSGGGAAAAEVQPAAPSKVARSGRAVKLPTRYA